MTILSLWQIQEGYFILLLKILITIHRSIWNDFKTTHEEHGGWISHTCMKQNQETSCSCCKWGREGVEGEWQQGRSNQCTK
jgi:hypothetical protein